ncbi:gag_pre-integrs domain-containing protein [Trichonephila clavipes]|nr:gag_pre-integrs domain-containing protein [Trichonephila clavipes]
MERRGLQRAVKIEAELILEANRLQLLKQDLEKAENAYLAVSLQRRTHDIFWCYGCSSWRFKCEVPQKFWGEALLCFTYAWNRISHKDSNKTPFKKYSGRKPSVLHLKPFGSLAHAGVPKQIRKKFDMHAKIGIMMGYAQRTKGYRIWLIDENKLVETINVRFDENKRVINFKQKAQSNLRFNLNLPDYYEEEDDFDSVKDSLASRLISKTSTEMPSTSEKTDVSSNNQSLIPCTEVKWIRNIDLTEQQALMVEVIIPNCYKQAIRSRKASKWHDAMDKENNLMMERKVWDLVDPPDKIKILENLCVYTINYDENNKIVRYKARLVVQGNTQLRDTVIYMKQPTGYEIDYNKVYSDIATNRDDRVSMGGFITFIDETPISWRLETHPQSPDLNPIENLWMHLDTEVREKNVTSKENLKEKLQEVWNSIDTEITKKLIESMPRHLEAVIKANGLFTKY